MIAYTILLAFVAAVHARPNSGSLEAVVTAPRTECPPTGHYLLPHEYDCTKFYYCEYGKKWDEPRDCAPGTEFSYHLQVCIHPAQANCNLPGVPPTETEAPETEVTEATTAAPSSTEASIISTTTAAPSTTEASIISTTTAEPSTTEASIISTTTAEPSTTEASIISTTTAAPSTTEASVISTTTAAPSTTEAAIISTTTAAPSTTEASIISTTTAAPSTTEASVISTTTAAPSTTEAAIISTTTAAPSTTEASIISTTTAAPSATEAAPTTEAAAELLPNGCPADFNIHQLLPHETNCAQFYYCNFGEKVLRDCAPGTHFNPTLQVCDWPENAGCANSGNGEDSEESTSAPSTTEASEISTTTSAPSTTEAAAISTTTSAPSTTEAAAISTTTAAPSTTEAAPTTEAAVDLLPNGCPADFNIHQLLPHETNCDQFYYCNFGEKVLRDCAPGTHFNPTLQVCDWPENAGCANSGNGEDSEESTAAPSTTEASEISTTTSAPATTEAAAISTTTSPPSTTEAAAISTTTAAPTTTEAAPTTEAAVELLPNGCPADFNIHQLLPHETNCAQFYYCNFGEKVLRDCAPGTHFNPTLQVCDWPENAGCANSGNGEDSEESTSAPSTTEASEISTTTSAPATTEAAAISTTTAAPSTTEAAPTTEAAVDLLPNGCPADFNIHQLLPHETNCDQFYYCNFGEKVLRDCAPGTHFNPTLQVCDWPENAGCANSGNGEDSEESTAAPSTTEASEISTTTSSPATTEAAAISTTTSPPSTTEAAAISTTTAAPTTTEAAPTTEAAVELLPNGCPADFNIHQLLPHETNCDQFYYCNFGEKVLRDCAPGTHFNPTLQVCDWPENAGCANSGNGEDSEESTSAPSTTEASEISTSTSGPSTTEAAAISTTTAAPSTTEAAPTTEAAVDLLPNGCPADFNIHQLLPHETNCDQFYYCNFGEKVLRDCPPGTHFNPTLQVCDWPENAGCANSGNGEDSEEITSAPSTTEASEISTTTSAPATTESGTISTTTFAPSTTEAATISTTTAAPSTTEAAPTTEAAAELLPNGCPADFNIHQLLPHETNCDQFYYCNFGEKVLRDCAPGTHFNPTLQVCDWPENAGCQLGGGSGEETDNGSGDNEGEGSGNGEDTDDGSGDAGGEDNGEDTDNGSGDNGNNEPGSGGNESAEDGNGDNGSGDGWLENGCPADWDIHYLLPHSSDCGKFYQCVFGNTVERECAAGLHFNPTLQVCDWPENAGCTVGGGNGSVEEGGSGDGNTDTDNGSGGEDGNTDTDNGSGGEDGNTDTDNGSGGEGGNTDTDNGSGGEGGSADNRCADSCNVAPWAHDSDCDKFWRCDGETPVLTVCAEGLHFNANSKTCDFICNAGCVRESAQTTLSRDGVMIFLPWDKMDQEMLETFSDSQNRHA